MPGSVFPFAKPSALSSVENGGLAGLRGALLGNPHPSDTHPDPGGRWVPSTRAGISRGQSLSEGWCCIGHSHGMAGSNTCLPGGTGGLWETEGQGSCRLLGTPCCPPQGAFLPSMPHPTPTSSACTCASRWAEAGKGAHAVNAGGSWGTGGSRAVVQVLVTAWAPPATHTHTVKVTS